MEAETIDVIRTKPRWADFIRFCEKIEFGEVTVLKIQNGVPVAAEMVTKKIKFA